MNIPLIIVICYIIFLMLVSAYSLKLVNKDRAGFLLAGRSWPWFMVAFMLVGLAVGGASTVGTAQKAFEQGIGAGWYTVAWGFSAVAMGLIGAARWRQLQVFTIPEMLGRHYGDGARLISVIIQFAIVMTICCLQFVAGGALLSAMLPEYFSMFSGSLLTAIVFVAIALIGGLWAGGLANLVNVLVIWIGIILGAIGAHTLAGGLDSIIPRLPTDIDYCHLTEGLGLSMIAAWFIVFILSTFSNQAALQIGFAAKTPRDSTLGYVIGGVIMAPLGFFAAYIGIAAKSIYPDIQSIHALPTIIMQTNPWLAGTTLAGLWAADISTGVALLTSAATLLQKDIYEWSLERQGKTIDSTKDHIVSRFLILILGGVGFFMALKFTAIIKTLLFAMALSAPFTIIFLFTTFRPSFCKKPSAFWTILLGFICAALWSFLPPFANFFKHIGLSHPVYMELAVCLPLFILFNMIFREPIDR